ncbi:AAEL003107-PA [Aedes aegypti]|uniref:AAEL003107-PA n=1 Tax=Aedes aegypti TaxID=7159 RepID=Q17GF0_AEDAE|nr:AAEL003107-PA [Aedes aegypti]
MKNEAISLALSSLLPLLFATGCIVQAAVDIFSGMESSTELSAEAPEPEAMEEHDHGLQTCVPDVYADESFKFDHQILTLDTINSSLKAIPKPPPMPKLPQTWSRFTNIFQLPRFSEMGQEFRDIVDQYRTVVQAYVNQWMGLFKQRYQSSVEKVQATVRRINQNIHDSFAEHFEEFHDVCLPDTDQCLQSMRKGIESYDQRLNENMKACGEFAKRQVEQHEQWVKNEQEVLERPFLRVEDCFGRGRVGESLASCVGNMVGNIVKASTDGLKRFSNTMAAASSSLSARLGKFQECVVNRKKLLDQGQERIADRAKECLRRKQTGAKDGDVFGGGGDFEDEGVF